MARSKTGGRNKGARAPPVTEDEDLLRKKKRKSGGGGGSDSGIGSDVSIRKQRSVRTRPETRERPAASALRSTTKRQIPRSDIGSGVIGGVRYRFVEPPPQEEMLDADLEVYERLAHWLANNGFIESVGSYRTVRSGNAGSRNRRRTK